MLSILFNRRNQTNKRLLLCGIVLVFFGFFDTCDVVLAQQNPRPVTYQTTNRANQAVSSARQVAVDPVKPVPDFWAIHSDETSLLALHDRLDRKNLPMLYHFSFDQFHRVDLPVGQPVIPSVTVSPEPQYRNHPNDLESRLRALRGSTVGDGRALAPTTPSPSPTSPDDSQQPGSVKIRRLPSVHGIVAIGDL